MTEILPGFEMVTVDRETLKGSCILEWGAAHVMSYTVDAYTRALRKADPDGVFTLDSNPRCQHFLAACTVWSIAKGYMEVLDVQQGDQEQITAVQFTDKGKEWVRKKE